jgi:hypothetical protein
MICAPASLSSSGPKGSLRVGRMYARAPEAASCGPSSLGDRGLRRALVLCELGRVTHW